MASAPDSTAALQPRDPASIFDHLDDLPDPTRAANTTGSIVFIATCAVPCGADTWLQIADHGRSQFDGLATFFELPGSIPSDSSTGRATTC